MHKSNIEIGDLVRINTSKSYDIVAWKKFEVLDFEVRTLCDRETNFHKSCNYLATVIKIEKTYYPRNTYYICILTNLNTLCWLDVNYIEKL